MAGPSRHISGTGDGSAARMGVSELWTRGAPLFPDGGTLDAGGGTGRSEGDHRTGGGGGRSEGGNGGSVLSDAKAPRPRWGSTSEFILAAVGSAVGLGNLLRFPHMVYKHGGLAFLVPYALAVVFLGVPVLAMELALGQVAQAGCVDALAAMHGRAWGIGCAATLAAFLLASYYCAVLAWAWCFLVATWSKVLPWSDGRANSFFVNDVLMRSDDLSDGVGPMLWWLVLGLTLTWVACFLCVMRGAESAGKAVWITMPLPYLMLLVLLFKGMSLAGSGTGVQFYLGQLDLHALGKGEAWIDAIAQIFFGLSICCGAMPAYASNCDRTERCGRNAWIVAASNSGTSLFAGFVVFTFLGYLAHAEGVGVGDVAEGGWGLAFVVYPSAMSLFGVPGGQFFATCFWIMILCLGIDSAFALIESVICACCDRFEYCARHRTFTALGCCFLCWCLGLTMCTTGGYYVVDIMDTYVSRYTLVIAGLCECLFVGWHYGAERLREETRRVSGHDFMGAGAYFPVAIKYVVPTVLTVMLCYQIGMEASGTYGGYPRWAIGIFGWLICVVTPLSLALLGCLKPLVLERKFCDAGDGSTAVFEDVGEEIEMGPSALNLPD